MPISPMGPSYGARGAEPSPGAKDAQESLFKIDKAMQRMAKDIWHTSDEMEIISNEFEKIRDFISPNPKLEALLQQIWEAAKELGIRDQSMPEARIQEILDTYTEARNTLLADLFFQ